MRTAAAFAAAVALSACSASGGAAETPDTARPTVSSSVPSSYKEGKKMVAALVDTSSLVEIAATVERWAAADGANNGDCHGLLRHAGVEFAKKKGLVEVPPAVCDYGLVHGMLYGYAEVVDDMDEYMRTVVPFCEKVSTAPGYLRDKCVHGIGHGLALLSPNDIGKGLDACDALSGDGRYYQCTGALVMEFGEDRLAALGWSLSHSAENSPTVMVVDEEKVPTLCDGRTATCHERYWMFTLPPRDTVSGTEDAPLAKSACERFTGEDEIRQCLTGFGHLASSFWLMFDFQDGVSYPPDSPEDADIAAQRAVDRCARHPDLGVCLLGLIPGTAPQLYYIRHPHIPDFCRFVPKTYVKDCEYAVNVAKNI